MEAGLIDEAGLRQIDEQAQHEVEAAVQFAEQSPDPSVEAFMSDLYNYVYAPDDPSLDVHEKED
jgi:pyruvate dehydrogenase E1 component alpha subunit